MEPGGRGSLIPFATMCLGFLAKEGKTINLFSNDLVCPPPPRHRPHQETCNLRVQGGRGQGRVGPDGALCKTRRACCTCGSICHLGFFASPSQRAESRTRQGDTKAICGDSLEVLGPRVTAGRPSEVVPGAGPRAAPSRPLGMPFGPRFRPASQLRPQNRSLFCCFCPAWSSRCRWRPQLLR